MASDSQRKRVRITDPVEARVELINGQFDLPPENVNAMKEVRAAISECAKRIKAAADQLPSAGTARDGRPSLGYDVGRMIAAMDTLQHAKDIACVSFILPYADKEVVIDDV